MLYSNNVAMQKALSPIFHRDSEMSKSLFLADWRAERNGMSETGVSNCDRYCGEWLTSELCNSKHNLHCILAVTGRQWSSRSAETWSRGFKFNTVCVATWRNHCSGANVEWTSGDPQQGWRCSSQDGQVWKQYPAWQWHHVWVQWVVDDRGADESNMFVIYTR